MTATHVTNVTFTCQDVTRGNGPLAGVKNGFKHMDLVSTHQSVLRYKGVKMSVVATVLIPLAGRAASRTTSRIPASVPLEVPPPHLPEHFPPFHFPLKQNPFNLPPLERNPYRVIPPKHDPLPPPKYYSSWQAAPKKTTYNVHQDPLVANYLQ